MSQLRRKLMMGQSVDEDYIVFADPNVEAICAAHWGKKGKLTYKQAAKVTSIGTVFRANTTITSFDELQYFTGLTSIGSADTSADGAFNGCTALASVVIPSTVTTIRGYAFYGCTNLAHVGSLTNITIIGTYAFYNCTALRIEVSCPNLTSIGASALRLSGITKILDLGSITATNTYLCSNCRNITEIHIPATCTSIGRAAFEVYNATATPTAVVYSYRTTPPSYGQSCFRAAKVSVVYVPSESVSSYKTTWSALSSKIQAMP